MSRILNALFGLPLDDDPAPEDLGWQASARMQDPVADQLQSMRRGYEEEADANPSMYDEDVVYRSQFFPVGEYESGRVGLAFPGIMVDAAESAVDAATLPGDVFLGRREATPEAAFNMASNFVGGGAFGGRLADDIGTLGISTGAGRNPNATIRERMAEGLVDPRARRERFYHGSSGFDNTDAQGNPVLDLERREFYDFRTHPYLKDLDKYFKRHGMPPARRPRDEISPIYSSSNPLVSSSYLPFPVAHDVAPNVSAGHAVWPDHVIEYDVELGDYFRRRGMGDPDQWSEAQVSNMFHRPSLNAHAGDPEPQFVIPDVANTIEPESNVGIFQAIPRNRTPFVQVDADFANWNAIPSRSVLDALRARGATPVQMGAADIVLNQYGRGSPTHRLTSTRDIEHAMRATGYANMQINNLFDVGRSLPWEVPSDVRIQLNPQEVSLQAIDADVQRKMLLNYMRDLGVELIDVDRDLLGTP